MSGVNKAIILGRLGKDPETKFLDNGNQVTNFSVATSESWKDKSGENQKRTEWHRIVAWGKTAELAAKYLAKGREVYIEGKIQTRSWDDKSGQKRYATEIVAQNITFIGSKGAGGGEKRESAPDNGADYGPPPMTNDDTPF